MEFFNFNEKFCFPCRGSREDEFELKLLSDPPDEIRALLSSDCIKLTHLRAIASIRNGRANLKGNSDLISNEPCQNGSLRLNFSTLNLERKKNKRGKNGSNS